MVKAKATTETPTETIAKTTDTASHLDAKGRLITVINLNALQFYRLTKVLGASANNAAAMELAVIASSVKKIDATEIAMPSTELEVEFLIQQLDFEGLTAAGEALKKLGKTDGKGIDIAKN